MSDTPIFDATLADAPVNIWQASPIFPRPEAPFIIPRVSFDARLTDWSISARTPIVVESYAATRAAFISREIVRASLTDPANLTFLRSADA